MADPLIKLSADFSDSEAKFLERKEFLAAIDVRDFAAMTLRTVDIDSKNASQNLNLNDTEADSLEMSVTSETSIVTPALLKTMHISTELLQIKNAVQYAYNHRIGMEAGSDLNGQLANYGINSIEAQSKTLATMVAVQKIIESGARYNSKQLIRAFTKSEKALVGGELKTVTAKDMGF